MCGIYGLLGSYEKERVHLYKDLLRHRGPDSSGVYFHKDFAYAHQRLEILGLSEGAQPIHGDGGFALVYNGEIYNCLELQKKYLQSNYRNDGLILFELLKLKGRGIIKELCGMFAFAFYHPHRKEHLLVRDTFGQKPLFFKQLSEEGLEFSSELKQLSQGHSVCRQSAYEFLFYSNPLPGHTLYEGIEELLPGSYLCFRDGEIEKGHYFSLSELFEPAHKKPKQNRSEFERSLEQGVMRHLLSDVPVALLLSSGIDSSVLATVLASLGKQDVHCYSLGFDDDEYDEELVIDDDDDTVPIEPQVETSCVCISMSVEGHVSSTCHSPSFLCI